MMKTREVQDAANTRWTCAQAMAGVDSAVADEASDRLLDDKGNVPVVCTPSGGAQTVRLRLVNGWEESLTDAELLSAIEMSSP